MKLNKKGVSLIELIISLSLIAVVMLFMYNLLSNVTFEKDNDSIASLNANNRTDIISTIEDSLMHINIGLHSLNEDKNKLVVESYIIEVKETNKILFWENDEIIRKWTIKGGTLGSIECKGSDVEPDLNVKFVECNIPVYTANSNNMETNNNSLDDISIIFAVKE